MKLSPPRWTGYHQGQERTLKTVDTEFGRVKAKFSSLGKEVMKAVPEYEYCKKIAWKHGVPLIQIRKKFS